MQALQFDPIKRTLDSVRTSIPVLSGPDDIIVRVAYAGVCGTDLHIIEGKFPASKHPIILGHEFCGTVYEVGTNVKNVRLGDSVGIDPQSSCYSCEFCRTGRYHICPNGALNTTLGIFSDGGWAEFCKVSQKQVYILPPAVSLKKAVLCEPMSCVYHGLNRISPIPIGSRILVNGAGIIGNLFCCVLHHTGHRNVHVSEPSATRREINKKIGTGFNVDHPDEIQRQCTENGIDICIDCSGNGKALEFGLNLLKRGGKLVIFGVASPETKISLSPFEIFLKELTIYGVTVNRFSFQQAVNVIEGMDRYIDFDNLGIAQFSLNNYKEAIKSLHEGKISKAVFMLHKELD